MTIIHRVTTTNEEFDVLPGTASTSPLTAVEEELAASLKGMAAHRRISSAVVFPEALPFSAPWRQTVERRRLRLAMELRRVRAEAPIANIQEMLDEAHKAAIAPVNVRKWWWGTEVERAWAHLREAEERILEYLPDDEAGLEDEALAHAKTLLPGDDRRILALQQIVEGKSTHASAAARRQVVVEAVKAAHAKSDQNNQEARFFRNRLLFASIFCAVFAAGLLVVQSRFPKAEFVQPPTDLNGSSAWTVLGLAMLLGCLGSLITAIPALSKVPSDFSPFNLPLQQAFLKIAVGALTSVIGLVIVASQTTDVTFDNRLAGFIILAIVFGAAQQAITKYVDSRATEILSPAPQSTATQ